MGRSYILSAALTLACAALAIALGCVPMDGPPGPAPGAPTASPAPRAPTPPAQPTPTPAPGSPSAPTAQPSPTPTPTPPTPTPLPPTPTPTPREKPLYGLCFGPYISGDPTRGDTVSAEQLATLLETIAPHCRAVRTYGVSAGLERVPALAKQRGLLVAAGCWLGRDSQANAAQVAKLIELVGQGVVDIAVVGNEVLHRGDLTAEQLLGYIAQVKQAAGQAGVPVTTNECSYIWLQNAQLVAACDLVMASIYPFYERQPIDAALASLRASFEALAAAAQGKEVIVGETGWPSAGEDMGPAHPSAQNAQRYLYEFAAWAGENGVRYFYFEAFDEPWKRQFEGELGAHWGLWTTELELKFPLPGEGGG